MSTNLPAGKPKAKPAESPTPRTDQNKAEFKPRPGTAKPDADPKRKADKAEPKRLQK